MKQLSKERLEEIAGMQVKETSNGYEHVPEAYSNVRSVEIVEMARRLLAVEGQVPVSDDYRLRIAAALESLLWPNVALGNKAVLQAAIETLRAPQPAPVAHPVQVPDGCNACRAAILQPSRLPRWTPCSELMPALGTRVLLYFAGCGGHIEDGCIGDEGDGPYHYFFDGDSLMTEPTHWMPLPADPQESTK